jgi:hypothetical protein
MTWADETPASDIASATAPRRRDRRPSGQAGLSPKPGRSTAIAMPILQHRPLSSQSPADEPPVQQTTSLAAARPDTPSSAHVARRGIDPRFTFASRSWDPAGTSRNGP